MDDDDAETLKDLVEKEEKEPTSPESHEKTNDEVGKIMSEITL